jgi:hypothetical protein
MSWTYVPEVELEAGSPDSSGCERCATSSGTPTASGSSKPGCGTEASTRPRCGTTSRPSTGDRGVDLWMASLEASRVSRGRLRVGEREKPTSAIFGPISDESFGKWNPDGSVLRTYQGCLLGGWEEWSESYPRAGLLWNGIAYPLAPLAPLTGGIASGLWPTPRANDDNRSPEAYLKMIHGRGRSEVSSLQVAAKMWPTPVVGDATGGRTWKGKDRPDEGGLRVEAMKRETFPTPRSEDSECAGGHRGTPDTLTAHARLWPTPQSCDATVQDEEKQSGQLNPRWVEWLMGWPPEWTNPNCSLIDPTPDTWAHEPPGVSRLAPKSMPARERRARLSIIGNGWVPQAAAVVFARIVEAFNTPTEE